MIIKQQNDFDTIIKENKDLENINKKKRPKYFEQIH
jgi:hypothetical protein